MTQLQKTVNSNKGITMENFESLTDQQQKFVLTIPDNGSRARLSIYGRLKPAFCSMP